MALIGKVRKRSRTVRGKPIPSKARAQEILTHVRGQLQEGVPIERALARYLPERSKPLLVPSKLEGWLKLKRDQVRAGDRSPTYLRELERYCAPGGHFSWWSTKSIHEIRAAALDDWEGWLRDEKSLSPKTRKNVLGAFRSFLEWLRRREEIDAIPPLPRISVPEHLPKPVSAGDQDAVLAKIPDELRGIFLAMALLGIRPGEARALDAADIREGWILVHRAVKGAWAHSDIRGTKTGRFKRLPMPEPLREWLERHPPRGAEFRGDVPLFRNPRAYNEGQRWTHGALSDEWGRACERAEIQVSLYEGTKHSFATDALSRGVDQRIIQAVLGHADIRSTSRYARLVDDRLKDALRESAPDDAEASPRGRVLPLGESR